jgi:hypothetical protein
VPTVLRSGPYRVFFYSADGAEPPHVHIERDESTAKFWLDPLRLDKSDGFSRKEIGVIETVVEDNRTFLLGAWNDFFGN